MMSLAGVGMLVAWLLARGLVLRPLDNLKQRTVALAEQRDVPTSSGGAVIRELRELSHHFDAMAAQVRDRNERLREERDNLDERVKQRTEELQQVVSRLEVEVAEREEAERKQREAAKAAAEANVAKSRFLATMSHEIRTPMTAILGYCELLAESDLGDESSEHVAVVRRNAGHLLRIINDILDLSKIESGRLEFETEPFELREVIDDVTELLRERAVAKQIRFGITVPDQLPRVLGDPTRLRQVLVNLLGNAIKFTDKGAVTLSVEIEAETVDGVAEHRVAFAIRDTGIGLTQEQQQRLFQPFVQADSSHTRRFGGTGLGLVISRRLVEGMGGELSLESAPRVGSTFRFEVRLAAAASKGTSIDSAGGRTAAPKEANGVGGLRVLLAEDGRDNQLLVTRYLEKAGAEVVVVGDGAQAVREIVDRPFDVVLMDMQMPVMDGYSATQALRQLGFEIPIVALTAHAMSEQRRECLDVGCDGFVSKPIDRSLLLATVAQFGRPDDEPSEAD